MISPPLARRARRQSLTTSASLLALAVLLVGSIADASTFTRKTREHRVTGTKGKKIRGQKFWRSAHRNFGLSFQRSLNDQQLAGDGSATTAERRQKPTAEKAAKDGKQKKLWTRVKEVSLVALVLAAILPRSAAAIDPGFSWVEGAGPPASKADVFNVKFMEVDKNGSPLPGEAYETIWRGPTTFVQFFNLPDGKHLMFTVNGCNKSGCGGDAKPVTIGPETDKTSPSPPKPKIVGISGDREGIEGFGF